MQLPTDADATGRHFGDAELELLKEVLRSGTLNATKGTMVKRLQAEFAAQYGAEYCCAMSSGTAAIHTAIAAISPEPGDEIITTAITDMGAIAPILYQGAIPVFADVDPTTYLITAETIEPHLTKRTKAIIVTHLFGRPCAMDPILDLARAYRLVVIEDAAQAYFAEYQGGRVGTIGDIGCFSLQQTKHMTAGEGGLTLTNNPTLARRMRLFVDKAWGYGDEHPDHYFLALNYRMTELQGAVAVAQLGKVMDVVRKRREMARLMDTHLTGTKGIQFPVCAPGETHVYWKYPLTVDTAVLGLSVDVLASRLKSVGIASAPRYIQKPAFLCEVLRDQVTLGTSRFPFNLRDDFQPLYHPEHYPGTMQALAQILLLPWNECYTPEHVSFIADHVKMFLTPCGQAGQPRDTHT